MTEQEMLERATRFEFEVGPKGREAVTVEMRDNGRGPHTGDGIKRWAVCYRGMCLRVSGKGWDWEPMPSSRTDAWLKRHRFTDVQAALRGASQAAELIKAGHDPLEAFVAKYPL